MADPAPPRADAIFSRDEFSPDGAWRVVYDYMDGERSPLIVSPSVMDTATGRVVLDLWKTGLNGFVDEFTATGFRLTVRDVYGPSIIVSAVDAVAGTFVLRDSSAPAHRLSELNHVFSVILEQARRDYLAQFPPPLPPTSPANSCFERVKRWFS